MGCTLWNSSLQEVWYDCYDGSALCCKQVECSNFSDANADNHFEVLQRCQQPVCLHTAGLMLGCMLSNDAAAATLHAYA
jgi:hypothetical protein